jgi:hypothetical protein
MGRRMKSNSNRQGAKDAKERQGERPNTGKSIKNGNHKAREGKEGRQAGQSHQTEKASHRGEHRGHRGANEFTGS